MGSFVDLPRDSIKFNLISGREFGFVRKKIMESRLRKYKRKQQPRKRPGFKSPLNPPNFLVSSGLDLVIYCANVWNEREADNACERRDFEEDEVNSHLGLSSARPFNWKVKLSNFSRYILLVFVLRRTFCNGHTETI